MGQKNFKEKYREDNSIIRIDYDRIIMEILIAKGINTRFLKNSEIKKIIIDKIKEILVNENNEINLDEIDLKMKIGVTKGPIKTDVRILENGDICILTRKLELRELNARIVKKLLVTEEVLNGKSTGNILVISKDKNEINERRYETALVEHDEI